MIGLDTNVLIRYITQDDVNQSKLANQIIDGGIKQGKLFWISLVTLCEIVWVLESCYELTHEDLKHVIHILIGNKNIEIEHAEVVEAALEDFSNHSNIEFTDCIIGQNNRYWECEFTYTFDRKASTVKTFKLLKM